MEDDDVTKSWLRLLDPDQLRPRMLAAGLVLAAFETLKDAIVDRIKSFFTHTWSRENGPEIDEEYQKDVLSRNRSPVYASLQWLKEMKAIDDEDLSAFEAIKGARNKLAHELIQFLLQDTDVSEFELYFDLCSALLHKIEAWWIINVDIATDPDLHDKEPVPDQVFSMSQVVLQVMRDVALGNEEESRLLLRMFRERMAQDQSQGESAP